MPEMPVPNPSPSKSGELACELAEQISSLLEGKQGLASMMALMMVLGESLDGAPEEIMPAKMVQFKEMIPTLVASLEMCALVIDRRLKEPN